MEDEFTKQAGKLGKFSKGNDDVCDQSEPVSVTPWPLVFPIGGCLKRSVFASNS